MRKAYSAGGELERDCVSLRSGGGWARCVACGACPVGPTARVWAYGRRVKVSSRTSSVSLGVCMC
jgi:hypothetical protein